MLCRTALDAHYASRMPVYGSMVQAGLPPAIVLATIHDALSLLRIVLALPIHIHSVVTSSSELLVMLLSCLSVLDMSQTSTTQVMLTYTDATDLLQSPRLTPEMRQVLDDFVLALSLVIGDNSKAASEAQMVQTMQLALGKGDISEPLPDTDHVTCSLLLQYLVSRQTTIVESGS
jgi:mediator of RNA polymerase II transcription subunit 5